MTVATTAPTSQPRARQPSFTYGNGAEWWHALGDVPLERVILDPLPGTATEQDLLVFVERDKRLCELIDGTLVEKPVGSDEAWMAGVIITALNTFVRPRKLGLVYPADALMRMSNGRVRLPDVSFVSGDRLAKMPKPRPPIYNLSPDLVVEVLSASNTRREIDQKLKEAFASGTKLAWIVDPPTRTVAVHVVAESPARTSTESGTLDGGDVLPGFTLPVREIFDADVY